MKKILIFGVSFILTLQCFAGKVEVYRLFSKAMEKEILSTVILPNNYKNSKQPFPTLYLLHGAGGSFKDWASNVPTLKNLVDQYQMIIVCPDGGKTSWYFDSPIDPKYQYETYITKELVPAIDQHYYTIESANKKAIAGLSMGGHGAIFLATKHPEIWGAAGSMSGGVDFRGFPNNWDLKKRLGEYKINKTIWDQHVVINLLKQIKASKLRLIIDCGEDDFFMNVNQSFHQKLQQHQIKHDFIVRPGAHNWEYWKNAVIYQMLFFDQYFKSS